MVSPALRPLFKLSLEIGERLDVGQGPRGQRVYASIAAGQFEGERLSGDVLPGGDDALLVNGSGHRLLDVRLVLRTRANALVYMTYTGVFAARDEAGAKVFDPVLGGSVDPSRYYMRFCGVFETGAPELGWLNGILALGIGARTAMGPSYEVFELL